jgi:hypothetical protein
MKTMKLFGVLVILLFLTIIQSSNTFASGPEKKDIHSVLQEAIAYPEPAIREGVEGPVTVEFKMNDQGLIDLKKVESSSMVLKNYVSEKMKELDLRTTDIQKYTTYRILFTFQLD